MIKRLIRVLLYADDAALLALSSGGLVALLTTFKEYCAAFGLRVFLKKTVALAQGACKVSEKMEDPTETGVKETEMILEGKTIDKFPTFKYLDSVLSLIHI